MATIDDQLQQLLATLQQRWTKAGQPSDPAYIGALQQYWQQLNDTQKRAVLAQVQKAGGNPQQFSQAVLQLTSPNAQGPQPAPTPKPDPNAPTAQQTQAAQSATQAATAAGVQLGETTSGQTGYGVPVMGTGEAAFTPGGTATGGFNEQLRSYTQNAISNAGQDVNALAQVAGTDAATLQAQYQAYTRGMAQARAAYTGHGALAGDPQGLQAGAQLTLPQFAQQVAQSTIGPWAAVLDAIASIWQSQYQQDMPLELRQQILASLNGLPPDQKKAVLLNAMYYMQQKATSVANRQVFDQTGNYTAQLLSSLPSSILTYSPAAGGGFGTGSLGTVGIVGTYAQLHPSPFLQKETIDAGIANQFQQALNRAPTAADMAKLGPNPTATEVDSYINSQPLPDDPKVQYGTYQNVKKFVDPLYAQYFGTQPTSDQLMAYMGMNQQQITDHIMASPSTQLPGATVGRYVQLRGFADSLVSKIGYGVSDQVIAAAHAGMQGQ